MQTLILTAEQARNVIAQAGLGLADRYSYDPHAGVLHFDDALAERIRAANPNKSTVNLPVLRALRDRLLAESDWAVLPDAPLSKAKVAEWKTYRQALRDATKTGALPEKPE